MKCYHVTTQDRLWSILCNGLLPNSKPNCFTSPTPYIMLSLRPWFNLVDIDNSVFLEISDPAIKQEYFDDPEGLRWDKPIKPRYIRIMTVLDILMHRLIDLRENATRELKRIDIVGTKKEHRAKWRGYCEAIDSAIGVILKIGDYPFVIRKQCGRIKAWVGLLLSLVSLHWWWQL